MTGSELEIRELSDWQVLREVRLRALADSPAAFMSTYDDEVALAEEEWELRLEGAAWLVASKGGEDIGLVGLVPGSPPPGARYIESTWVAPAHRQQGVFSSLLWRLVEMGRDAHLDSLFLWVVGHNIVARRAYKSLGFVETGDDQLIDEGGRYERRLRLDVSDQRTTR
jgi:GNAT superfamily N-acetyltransferase